MTPSGRVCRMHFFCASKPASAAIPERERPRLIQLTLYAMLRGGGKRWAERDTPTLSTGSAGPQAAVRAPLNALRRSCACTDVERTVAQRFVLLTPLTPPTHLNHAMTRVGCGDCVGVVGAVVHVLGYVG